MLVGFCRVAKPLMLVSSFCFARHMSMSVTEEWLIWIKTWPRYNRTRRVSKKSTDLWWNDDAFSRSFVPSALPVVCHISTGIRGLVSPKYNSSDVELGLAWAHNPRQYTISKGIVVVLLPLWHDNTITQRTWTWRVKGDEVSLVVLLPAKSWRVVRFLG